MAAPESAFSIIAPGTYGLNTQSSIDTLDPRFCLNNQNTVLDAAGRTSSRKGYVAVTSSPLGGTPNIQQIFEYVSNTGATGFLSCANNNIYSGSTTLTSVYSTAITANNWQAVNFNNFMWFFQRAHAPLRWDGATMVTILSLGGAGVPPQGNAVLGAFGRLWVADTSTDKITVYFSDTLAGQTWTGGTSGTLNLNSVWQNGMDSVVALASFQGFLIIFGRKSILIYSGASVPSTMVLQEVIKGVGCIARDSIQNIGTDLYFLSDTGIRSLQRTIQTTTMPMADISKNVRDSILSYAVQDNLDLARSVYHEPEGFYLINFPTNGVTFCFSLRRTLDDGSNPVTIWNHINPKAMLSSRDRTLYLGHAGIISKYSGYQDNGTSFDFDFVSAWMGFGEPNRQDILKKLLFTVVGANGQTFTAKWFWDFSSAAFSSQVAVMPRTFAEYNIAQYNIDEYSTGVGVDQISIPGASTGKLLQVGLFASISGSQLALHKIDAYAKPGRMI